MRTFKVIHFCSATYLWIRQGGYWMWLHACCWKWHQARWYRWIFPAFRTGSSPGPFLSHSLFPSFFFPFWQTCYCPVSLCCVSSARIAFISSPRVFLRTNWQEANLLMLLCPSSRFPVPAHSRRIHRSLRESFTLNFSMRELQNATLKLLC